MSRAPVSVVVVASGTADIFRDCLDSLRVSRDQRDEVACVVPGDRPDLLTVAEPEQWLTIVPHDTGRAADAWTAGLDATRHPVVVLLDGDVLLTPHWLDPIAEVFGDAEVVAAGPRCDRTFGPQEAHLPSHALRTRDALKEFARHWRHQHRGRVSAVERLGAVCVAVRREALATAGGPDAELPFARLAERGRIVVAHESLVAHLRSPRCTVHALAARHGPFLSAVVLTRDDEATIEGCLRSVQPFADEILVYDLGSSDRTRERAEALGATVVAGRFDGDFGAARTRALTAATGEWALCIDPDETAAGDPMAVRGRLLFTNTEAILLPVRAEERAAAVPAFALRLFKRQRVRYTGRRHELAVDRVSGEPVSTSAVLDLLEMLHPGGAPAGNLRNAGRSAAELDAVAATQLDRAHAAIAAGNYPAAARLCREIIDGDLRGGVYELALKSLMNALIPMGQLDEANRVLGELRLRSATPFGPDEWEARIRFAEGDFPAAIDAVHRLPARPLPGGPPSAYRDQLAEIEIKSLFLLERPAEAAARLRECLRAGLLPLTLAETAEALSADGSGLAEVVELVPAERRRALYQLIGAAPADLADEMLEALWAIPDEAAGVLGAAAQIGGLLPLHRAHAWSVRLRSANPFGRGMNRHCALLRIAEHPDRTPRDRALAAAVAMERFGTVEALPLLSEALGAMPDEQEAQVLEELREIAPGVVALTTTTHGGGS
ncbi:glycosyltransferase [Dactylosporangium sp. CA-139066]|uniref:glycosyltransferase n=1 Tax=Dactylosporangium sp. CA-139066 TaxID=3239930 RepID=UPI003D904E96